MFPDGNEIKQQEMFYPTSRWIKLDLPSNLPAVVRCFLFSPWTGGEHSGRLFITLATTAPGPIPVAEVPIIRASPVIARIIIFCNNARARCAPSPRM